MSKIDYKKDFKELYLPKQSPVLIDVPAMNFIMIDGVGDPSGSEYQNAVSALYGLSYTIKMKGKDVSGYCEYTVFPLEGLWWTNDGAFDFQKRNNWLWTSMIRQPDFVTSKVFEWALELAQTKKKELDFSNVKFESFEEGLCVQSLHVGPYSEEPSTIEKMQIYMEENNLLDKTGDIRKHHEIYLSDPNRVSSEKMNTVLRHPVEKIKG